ncbi:hypothetical protein Golomagni_06166, partial [Golovinomyces magnicellulatus]
FVLYRFSQSSWEQSPLQNIPQRPASPIKDDSIKQPPVDARPPPAAQEPQQDKQDAPAPHVGKEKTEDDEPIKVEIPTLKEHGDVQRPVDAFDKDLVSIGQGIDANHGPGSTSTDSKSTDTKWDQGKEAPGLEKPKPIDNNPLQKPPNSKEGTPPNPLGENHWKRLPENFPIPSESIIALPTAKPKAIPKIQFDFAPESEKSKSVRTERLAAVKKELQRSWKGYKDYGWMHDEVKPQSGGFKDPFCGWAATLVDSLDTLWIAGMHAEFDEAVKAVKKIDFTYSEVKQVIPVFETTIRYLGGLLAAYDVSGGSKGKYKVLLDKAVELGEVLMGIFDTPNRMPVLYFYYAPDFTSQPHRATTGGMAELATLSMEFTRLAQLTGKDKYYDAVARITDGLVELSDAGTAMPGLFPENLDISGCNRSATVPKESMSRAAQKVVEQEELKAAAKSDPKGYIPMPDPQDDSESETKPAERINDDDKVQKRASIPPTRDTTPGDTNSAKSVPAQGIPHQRTEKPPHNADGTTSNWDCVRQGLIPASRGYQTFHMGGGQDSAYEYFPKEYLLLGGLESKYQRLHVDAVEATDKWLMFRPMIKDPKWDILFPAKVSTTGDPQNDKMPTYEMTHLTCFLGGMYGLGGKIFGRDKDIETAKKLTDGCVWAYQSTTTGVMPEGAHLIPCPSLDKCEFNETLWHEELDPGKEYRDQQVADWELKWNKVGKQSSTKADPSLKSESDKTAPKKANDGPTAQEVQEAVGNIMAPEQAAAKGSDADSAQAVDKTDAKNNHMDKRDIDLSD